MARSARAPCPCPQMYLRMAGRMLKLSRAWMALSMGCTMKGMAAGRWKQKWTLACVRHSHQWGAQCRESCRQDRCLSRSAVTEAAVVHEDVNDVLLNLLQIESTARDKAAAATRVHLPNLCCRLQPDAGLQHTAAYVWAAPRNT